MILASKDLSEGSGEILSSDDGTRNVAVNI